MSTRADQLELMSRLHFQKLAALSVRAEGAQRMGAAAARAHGLPKLASGVSGLPGVGRVRPLTQEEMEKVALGGIFSALKGGLHAAKGAFKAVRSAGGGVGRAVGQAVTQGAKGVGETHQLFRQQAGLLRSGGHGRLASLRGAEARMKAFAPGQYKPGTTGGSITGPTGQALSSAPAAPPAAAPLPPASTGQPLPKLAPGRGGGYTQVVNEARGYGRAPSPGVSMTPAPKGLSMVNMSGPQPAMGAAAATANRAGALKPLKDVATNVPGGGGGGKGSTIGEVATLPGSASLQAPASVPPANLGTGVSRSATVATRASAPAPAPAQAPAPAPSAQGRLQPAEPAPAPQGRLQPAEPARVTPAEVEPVAAPAPSLATAPAPAPPSASSPAGGVTPKGKPSLDDRIAQAERAGDMRDAINAEDMERLGITPTMFRAAEQGRLLPAAAEAAPAAAAAAPAKKSLWGRVPLSLKAPLLGGGVLLGGAGLALPVAAGAGAYSALQPNPYPHVYGGGAPIPQGGLY